MSARVRVAGSAISSSKSIVRLSSFHLHNQSATARRITTSHRFNMPVPATPWVPNRYPTARRTDHVDVYKSEAQGEVRVPNPYNWLEEDSEDTDKWTSAQEGFTREYLDLNPERQELEDAIRKSTDYAKVCNVIYALIESLIVFCSSSPLQV